MTVLLKSWSTSAPKKRDQMVSGLFVYISCDDCYREKHNLREGEEAEKYIPHAEGTKKGEEKKTSHI